MEPIIKLVKPLRVVGKRYVVKMIEGQPNPIPGYWTDGHKDGTIKFLLEGTKYSQPLLGICGKCMGDSSFEYYIGTIWPDDLEIPNDFDLLNIPETKYAIFTAKGPCNIAISKTFGTAFNWLKNQNQYTKDNNGYDIEWYGEESCNPDSEDSITYVYIPIK